jgi:hypothetical protein
MLLHRVNLPSLLTVLLFAFISLDLTCALENAVKTIDPEETIRDTVDSSVHTDTTDVMVSEQQQQPEQRRELFWSLVFLSTLSFQLYIAFFSCVVFFLTLPVAVPKTIKWTF